MWGSKKDKGLYFEQQALNWLQQKGLKPVQQNYSCRLGEIDLIMLHLDTLCFIEVKYRKNNAFGGIAYSIPASKQHKITKAALTFISSHQKFQQHNYRFDALFITPEDNLRQDSFEWIQNAFSTEQSDFY